MKKRESLKNFHDPRIDRLLREEDRLLKSVHMRLGFVLHFRAERSEGAQTAMSKLEFRTLVSDVVRELDGQDSESTVSSVMEATTNRLVLVNTPDSGDFVRFDIRQLQEFFAAEYLYTGIAPDEIGRRLEVIGGDAHWREVVHFILSALIENQKSAEIAVAVQALRKLNEGADFPLEILGRRTAKAARIAVRLLTEGVLEQDNRDRIQLRPLIEPIGGVLDLSSLRAVAAIPHLRSRQWLISILIERVRNTQPSEFLGAMTILSIALPEIHSEAEFLRARFGSLSPDSKSVVISALNVDHAYYPFRRKGAHKRLSGWFILACIEALNSDRCLEMTRDAFMTMFRICRDGLPAVRAKAIELWSEGFVVGLETCLSLPIRYEGEIPQEDGDDCGFIRRVRMKYSWMNGLIPEEFQAVNFGECIALSGGVLKIAFLCCNVAVQKSISSIEYFLAQVPVSSENILSKIPNGVLALVPISDHWSIEPLSTMPLRRLSKDTYAGIISEAIKENILPLASSLFLLDSADNINIEDEERWSNLAMAMPKLAVEFAMNGTIFKLPADSVIPMSVAKLSTQRPDFFAPLFLSWGRLCHSNKLQLEILRRAMKNVDFTKIDVIDANYEQIFPFSLIFPGEEYLLPLLAKCLSIAASANPRARRNIDYEKRQAIMTSYGISREVLLSIWLESSQAMIVRAAVLALQWIFGGQDEKSEQPNQSSLDLHVVREKYLSVVSAENEDWLTSALVDAVLIESGEDAAGAALLVASILQRCEGGAGPRSAIQRLFNFWGEESLAPVTTNSIAASWLGYSAAIPTYCL